MLALRKAVPSMEGGFIINTVTGDVGFHDADAEAIAGFVRALLEAKLPARRALARQTAVPSSRGRGSAPGTSHSEQSLARMRGTEVPADAQINGTAGSPSASGGRRLRRTAPK